MSGNVASASPQVLPTVPTAKTIALMLDFCTDMPYLLSSRASRDVHSFAYQSNTSVMLPLISERPNTHTNLTQGPHYLVM